GFTGQEFACGLCHDIGRLLVAVGAPAYFDLADPMDFIENDGLLVHEQEILGTDHSRLGAWFSRINELPEALNQAIRFPHSLGEAAEGGQLAGLVAVADHMANHIQRHEDLAAYDVEANEAWGFAAPHWWQEKTGLFADVAAAI